ncbi:MAG: hypothetical protein L3J79_01320 [Candidatus Marinimicrobia bacterium]|nr:hypothetical protein [Candidatus Neomarinimicrobiota bacterium]
MRALILFFCTANLLLAQIIFTPAWFNFNSESTQTFPVPFDDEWRSFSAPFEMVEVPETGIDRVELIVGLWYFNPTPFDSVFSYYLDNIRFPSNAFIDFESDSFEVSFSQGVVLAERVPHLNGEGYMLHIETNIYETVSGDTIWIEEPENFYPAIPDSVGLMMRSDDDEAYFGDYLPYDYTYWLYKPSDSNVGHSAIFEAPVNHSFGGGDTLIVLETRKWNYPHMDNAHIEPVVFEEVQYVYTDEGEIILDEIPYDFTLKLNEYTGDDTSFGVLLYAEEYQNILGYPRFVKSFSPDGIPGANLHFGWGIGITRWDIAGTNVHWDLVGKHQMVHSIGELDLTESLSIGFDQAFSPFKTYPLDTTWYQYNIPVEQLFIEGEPAGSVDSLVLVLRPEILIFQHTGRIQLNGLRVWNESNLVYDFGAQDPDDWLMDIALNGSGMYWESCDAQPLGAITPSYELVFYNDMQGSMNFAGFAEFTAHFDETVQLSDDAYLDFWMRKAPTITAINDKDLGIQPDQVGLVNAYPNPFNGVVALSLTVPENKGRALAVIFDIQGRQIWEYELRGPRGNQQVAWDGSNNQGLPMSSGVYLAVMILDGRPVGEFQKLILLK